MDQPLGRAGRWCARGAGMLLLLAAGCGKPTTDGAGAGTEMTGADRDDGTGADGRSSGDQSLGDGGNNGRSTADPSPGDGPTDAGSAGDRGAEDAGGQVESGGADAGDTGTAEASHRGWGIGGPPCTPGLAPLHDDLDATLLYENPSPFDLRGPTPVNGGVVFLVNGYLSLLDPTGAVRPLADGLNRHSPVVSNATHVFGVKDASLVRIALSSTDPGTEVVLDEFSIYDAIVAADDSFVYFSRQGTSATAEAVPVSGGVPFVLAEDVSPPAGLIRDQQGGTYFVRQTSTADELVYQADSGALTVLATDPQLSCFALDGADLLFGSEAGIERLENQEPGHRSLLMRMPERMGASNMMVGLYPRPEGIYWISLARSTGFLARDGSRCVEEVRGAPSNPVVTNGSGYYFARGQSIYRLN